MRIAFALLLFPIVPVACLVSLAACSGGAGTPSGACTPSDPTCNPGAVDSGPTDAHDGKTDASDAAPEATATAPTDASATGSDACLLWVDDAGVTQGCGSGGMGPGDRDDGGGAPPPPPPDAALDASNLGFGASCWDNLQCASDLASTTRPAVSSARRSASRTPTAPRRRPGATAWACAGSRTGLEAGPEERSPVGCRETRAMEEALAYGSLAMTVMLAVSRPRIGLRGLRFSPGTAALFGVVILVLSGLLGLDDMLASARLQWRPLVALTCVMVMTGVVQEVGAFARLSRRIESHARATSATTAFTLVFVLSVVTPSLLNNDSAILILTPLVVVLTRRLYPTRPEVTEAFAFAVFLAPGVAPFVVSNPMNMIVAEFAGVGFGAYARVMAPISLAGALLTYVILRCASAGSSSPRGAPRFTSRSRRVIPANGRR